MRYCYAIPHYKRHRLRIAVSTILLITILGTPYIMARSDSFFIRASVTPDDSDTFVSTSIDLGSYVDALGKSVLRVHNVSASITTDTGLAPLMDAGVGGACSWQITTQDQLGMVLPANRAVVSSGSVWAFNADGVSAVPATAYEADMLPQEWTNGYLIAVESLQLGAQATANWAATSNVTVSVVLECTVETLTQAAAMALALSQQGN